MKHRRWKYKGLLTLGDENSAFRFEDQFGRQGGGQQAKLTFGESNGLAVARGCRFATHNTENAQFGIQRNRGPARSIQ